MKTTQNVKNRIKPTIKDALRASTVNDSSHFYASGGTQTWSDQSKSLGGVIGEVWK